jgi:cytochrome c biogenesis protein
VPDLKNFITARRLSLSLILVLAGMMFLSTLIPQTMDSAPDKMDAWRHGHEQLLWLIDGAHLHRIYVQPWFAATILLAAAALAISSYDQIVAARRRLNSIETGSGDELAAAVSEHTLRSVAISCRYRCFQPNPPGRLKFIRNPWGYFGNVLLHIGMVLVAVASFYVALTGRQGALILVEGEQHDNNPAWNGSERGILASPLVLPGSVKLTKVRVSFNAKNQPAEVSSDITITDDAGRAESFTAAINRISSYRGLRVYHASQYGDAFSLEFIDAKGDTHFEKLPLQQPVNPTTAGYGDFDLKWSPYLLSAKYFADVNLKSMSGSTPLLVMRLVNKEQEISRASLTPGSSALLGDYRVRLLAVEKWSKLIFVDISGMPVIFIGFAIIMLGGLIHYMTPPRELIAIRQPDSSYRVYWKAASFREFFMEERDGLATALNKEIP